VAELIFGSYGDTVDTNFAAKVEAYRDVMAGESCDGTTVYLPSDVTSVADCVIDLTPSRILTS